MGGSQSTTTKPQPSPAIPAPAPPPKPAVTSTTTHAGTASVYIYKHRSTSVTSTTTTSPQHIASSAQGPSYTNTCIVRSSVAADKHTLKPALPATQRVLHSINNYCIPAVESRDGYDTRDITSCQHTNLRKQHLRVCPQYNGQGCVAKTCRRLHVCLHWATETCRKSRCKYDHYLNSVHNRNLMKAYTGRQECIYDLNKMIIDNHVEKPLSQEKQEICLFSVLRKCTKESCSRVHCPKTYKWEVKHGSKWIQFSFSQSDYLEMMFCHPSELSVDLIPLQSNIGNNRNLQMLKSLLSKETSWTVDLETFELFGASAVHDIRRLCTASDLTSRIPAASRWLWYWEDDTGHWEVYAEGTVRERYYLALSDHLENVLRVHKNRYITIGCGNFTYTIDGELMTQTNTTTSKIRRVRRRPAFSSVMRKSVNFDEQFLPLPSTKKFLKLPVMPLSHEFFFVKDLMKQTLQGLRISSMYRVQNDYLWKVYQNKKRLLTSLYNGDATATNEQYLFHCTGHDVVDKICEENLDWKLWGSNVGHAFGQGTYFSNMAVVAHHYGKQDKMGRTVMLVMMVLVGKMTIGNSSMDFPPMNKSAGRTYDTTCNSTSDASIFVKYNRDEYYPAYVVTYTA